MSGQVPDEGMTSPLEHELAGLAPSAGQFSRDRALFEAGKAAARPRPFWPVAALASSLGCVALAVLLALRPEPEVRHVYVDRFIPVPVAPETDSVPTPSPPGGEHSPPVPSTAEEMDYLRRRQELVRWGVDMWSMPPPRPSGAEPLTPASAFDRNPDLN